MTTDLGPVSKTLEADLREWVRKHGILVWLDLDAHYSGFVDRVMLLRAQDELPYDVRAYRGSFLELLLSLASLAVRDSLAQAVDRYHERGYAVDQAHRHLEQRRMALLYPQIPEFAGVRDQLDRMRTLWRARADGCARELKVSDPDSRKRAIHARVGGATCPWLALEEVVSRDATSLKQAVARARLVVVHSLEIDNAGEKGVGPAFFDHAIQRLRAAWRLLRDAGVRCFVITADHGFLLLDSDVGAVQSHGRKIDPKRRYVLSSMAADHRDEVRVALEDLGYEGVSGHRARSHFPRITP